MKPKFRLLGTTVMAASLAFGLASCSSDRDRAGADREMDTTADRMSPDDPRRHDAQNSTGSSAGALGDPTGRTSADVAAMDRQWVTKAAHGGIAEVQLGKLAQEKGSTEQVKDFGRKMVEDHTAANDRLKEIASSKGIDVPADTDAKHKSAIDRLSSLSGAQFDRAYMQEMLKDHRADVAHFEKGSNRLQDPDLKSFASETLPKLKEHLNHLQAMRGGAQSRSSADRSR